MQKKLEQPLVCVSVEGHWSADEDAILTYTIQENFAACTSDWIGLYKVTQCKYISKKKKIKKEKWQKRLPHNWEWVLKSV